MWKTWVSPWYFPCMREFQVEEMVKLLKKRGKLV